MDNQESRQFSFTNRRLDSIKTPVGNIKKQIEYSDTNYVGLKIIFSCITGRKKFYQRLYLNGKKLNLSLGEYPSVTIEQAREEFNYNKSLASKGLNPVIERKKKFDRLTLREFAEQIYLPYAKTKKKTWHDDQLKLDRDIYDYFKGLYIDDISRSDIVKYLNKIQERTGPATSNRHRSLLGSMLSVAVSHEKIVRNVVTTIDKFPESKDHGRCLTSDEQRGLMEVLDTHKNQKSALVIKLLLLTGMRRGECLRILNKNIYLSDRYLLLEAHTTKTGLQRKVPLNDLALEVLNNLKSHKVSGNPYLFPGVKKGSHLTTVRKTFESCKKAANIYNFRLHDCRHHFCTILSQKGAIQSEIQDLMGHLSPAMQKIYNHSDNLHFKAADLVAEAFAVGQ